ncbi:hypothetical protein Tco_0952287 [Tanacetum coccineum]|uniref:Uncharacterized protein n=1 Tax=Tanacetum coccineum TaxID=301880 RepID=A0ABQ5DWM5_9ASTR
MKEVVKESGAKRKKTLPRKRRTVKRQKLEEDAEKEELKGFLDIILREDGCKIELNLSYNKDDGSFKNYKDFEEMLKNLIRQDNGIAIHMLTEKKYSLSQEIISKMLKKKIVRTPFASLLKGDPSLTEIMPRACIFTDRWSLDELAYGVPKDGPYQTNLPSPDDIILSIQIDKEGQVRRIRHEKEIDVLEYQVLTREIEPTVKHLEEIIRENVFCLGDVPPRPLNPQPLQSHPSLDITLSLSPITPLDHIHDTLSPPSPPQPQPPIMGYPLYYNYHDYHGNDKKYTASMTKSKAARYELKGIEDMVPNLWSPVKSIISVKVNEWYGYGHLEEIVVKRADQQLYTFKEGDFKRLHLNDTEDMLLLVVQNKLNNLDGNVVVHLAVSLRMFARRTVIQERVEDLQLRIESYQKKLNLTKPRTQDVDMSRRPAYITLSNPQGVIYEDNLKRKRFMHADELHNLDQQRTRIMIKSINQKLLDRRIMRSLEKFVGGREYGEDLDCFSRQYDFVISCSTL